MENKIEALSQTFRSSENGMDYFQVNRFTPDLKLVIKTYAAHENNTPVEEDLLYELEFPVQKKKWLRLLRHIEREFDELPLGRSDSPAYLQVDRQESQRRYAWEEEKTVSEAFSKLFDLVTQIVSYSSIPSG